MSLAREALLVAIRFYQRHVSPRKGYRCAYRVHTGRCGCSALG
jgi:putative component of membrane protein insertase Oxa1/YidC/SpoIIIJ protein YidD